MLNCHEIYLNYTLMILRYKLPKQQVMTHSWTQCILAGSGFSESETNKYPECSTFQLPSFKTVKVKHYYQGLPITKQKCLCFWEKTALLNSCLGNWLSSVQFQLCHILSFTALALVGLFFSWNIHPLWKLNFSLMCEKSFKSFSVRVAPITHSRQRENVKGNAEVKDQMEWGRGNRVQFSGID